MKSESKTMSIWSGVFIIIAVIFFAIATYKLVSYNNSQYSPVNAYVGGDAYNYIINAGRSTAYYVVSMGNLICGVLLAVGSAIINHLGYEKKMDVNEVKPDDSLPPL